MTILNSAVGEAIASKPMLNTNCGEPRNTNSGKKANDKVILVDYFPDVKKAVFIIGAAIRKDGEALLKTTQDRGKIAETWIGFLSNDEADAADSVYCGRVDL